MAQAEIPKSTLKDYNGGAHADMNGIREDIESLKANVMSLSKHLQRDGAAKASEVKTAINEGLDVLLSKGDKSILAIENEVKLNPRRALVMAFMAGFAINLLLSRR
jgi:hypothetical protein